MRTLCGTILAAACVALALTPAAMAAETACYISEKGSASAVPSKVADPGLQNPARVDAIAAMLPERPRCEGRPISDRAAWDALAATDAGRGKIAEAVRAMNEPPVALSDEYYTDINRSGNRTRYESQFNQHSRKFQLFVLAECLENRGRFLPQISTYLSAILSERSWVLPAHDRKLKVFSGKKCYVDLASCERALMLAVASGWLGDRLSAAQHERIRGECMRRVFDPFLASARRSDRIDPDHWWYRGALNWNSVCHSATVRAALMLVDDRRTRAEFVESAERCTKVALCGYTDDGYCSEGAGYWNYGWGWQLRLAVAVMDATGGKVNICADPKCRRVMEYANGNLLTPRSVPNYADGGGARPDPSTLALGLRLWPDMAFPAGESPKTLDGGLGLVALLDFAPKPSFKTDAALPPHTWFDIAQVYLGRAKTKKGVSFGFSVKGGNNGDSRHSHNDVGSWCLALGNVLVGGDPDPAVYTGKTFGPGRYDSPFVGSYGHPVPLVAGRTQSPGAQFAAKVLKADFGTDCDTVVLDLKDAYEVPELVSLVRTVVFNRAECTVRISDAVRFSKPSAFEVPVVTYMDVIAGYEPGGFSLRVPGKSDVSLAFSAPSGGPWRVNGELMFNPTRSSAKRLAIAFEQPVLEAEAVTTFALK